MSPEKRRVTVEVDAVTTPQFEATMQQVVDALDGVRAAAEALKPTPPTHETRVAVKSEPLTYTERGQHSFFGDLIEARRGNSAARERLERHDRETRSNPTTTLGAGGEFAPPAWLISKWAGPARPSRVLANLIPNMPLPAGVHTIHVPKATTGLLTGIQPAEGAAEVEQDLVTQDNNSPVVSIAGMADVSIQLYEQTPDNPGFDAIAFTDLQRDYDAQLENQLINGTGTNGQLLGLANFSIPTANSIDASGSTTITTLWPQFGQAYAAVGNNRRQSPECWILAPRRWAFIASSLDNSNRPIASPHSEWHRSDTIADSVLPVSTMVGAPVYLSGAVISAATQPDSGYALRPSDMMLFEGDPKMLVSMNSLSGTLQVRLSLRRYVAFVGNRFSGGLAVLKNMPQPTNF